MYPVEANPSMQQHNGEVLRATETRSYTLCAWVADARCSQYHATKLEFVFLMSVMASLQQHHVLPTNLATCVVHSEDGLVTMNRDDCTLLHSFL